MLHTAANNQLNAHKPTNTVVNTETQVNHRPPVSAVGSETGSLQNHQTDLDIHGHYLNGKSYAKLKEDKSVSQGVSKFLLNSDIPPSQFLNVVEFGCGHDDEDLEEGSIFSGTEENFDTSSKGSYTQSLLEQSLEVNSDLFEQQQAVEQARLLQSLKTLRMVQLQKQEELMHKHQQELLLLQAENQEIQQRFMKERQTAWGGKPAKASSTEQLNKAMQNSPTKQKSISLASALPKTFTQMTVAMSKTNLGPSLSALVNLQSLGSLPVMVQKGRPLPVFHGSNEKSPADNKEHDNLIADSECNSIESQSQIDGICPLPDSGSEISEAPDESTFADAASAAACVRRILNFKESRFFSGSVEERQETDREFNGINALSNRVPELSHQNHLSLQQLPVLTDQLAVKGKLMMDIIPEEADVKSTMNDEFNDENDDIKEEEVEEEQEENQTESGDSILIYEKNRSNLNYDEKPIAGFGNRKKTFEELLEEELNKELQQPIEQVEGVAAAVHKYSFLRKGKGLEKFQNHSSAESPTQKRSTQAASKSTRTAVQTITQPSKVPTTKDKFSRDKKITVPPAKFQLKKPSQQADKKMSSVTSKGGMVAEDVALVKQDSIPVRDEVQKRLVNTVKGKSGLQFPATVLKTTSVVSQPKSSVSAATSQSKLVTLVTNESLKSAASVGADQLEFSNRQLAMPVYNGFNKHADLMVKVSTTGDNSLSENDLGDKSFQKCLQKIAKREETELEELEEFELLEQYAEDNASFLSSVSAVNRVLGQHKTKMKSQVEMINRAPRLTSAAECSDDDLSLDGTLVESSLDETEVEASEVDSADENEKFDSQLEAEEAFHVNSDRLKSFQLLENKDGCFSEPRVMQRKIASFQNPVAQKALYSDTLNAEQFHFTGGTSDSVMDAKLDSLKDEGPGVMSGKRAGVLGDLEASDTLTRRKFIPKSGAADIMEKPKSFVNFDDDISWEETNEHEVVVQTKDLGKRLASRSSESVKDLNSLPSHSKDGLSTAAAAAGDDDADVEARMESVLPPTSKLVAKLFPKLKPDPPKQRLQTEQEQKQELVQQSEIGSGVQSKLLREKIVELENEIQKFRNQNAALDKLRREREEGLVLLKKEMAEFEKQKEEELNRLQEFKATEMKKLKKERKVFEQYQKSSREQPNKKEREEIEMLKTQLAKLQEEVQRKEQRWTASTSRLRDRIEQLEKEKEELKDENQLLEQRRLEAWQSRKASVTIPTSAAHQLMQENEPDGAAILPNVVQQPVRVKQSRSEQILKLDGSAEVSHPIAGPRVPGAASVSSQAVKDLRRHTLSGMKIDSVGETEPANVQLSKTSSTPTQGTSTSPLFCLPGNSEKSQNVEKVLSRKTASAVPSSILKPLDKGDNKYETIKHADGKTERIFSNGMREVVFSNGTRKQVSSDGHTIIVYFFNGDIKQILPDQTVVYYYADAQTTHTTYADGLEILKFPNQQTEKHYPDGTKEIQCPDGTIKYIFPSGVEESILQDGSRMRVEKNGDVVLEFMNGQREVHTQMYKRREYPDGTVKILYPDGRQETRYVSGRLRVKDKDGNILVDKQMR